MKLALTAAAVEKAMEPEAAEKEGKAEGKEAEAAGIAAAAKALAVAHLTCSSTQPTMSARF